MPRQSNLDWDEGWPEPGNSCQPGKGGTPAIALALALILTLIDLIPDPFALPLVKPVLTLSLSLILALKMRCKAYVAILCLGTWISARVRP